MDITYIWLLLGIALLIAEVLHVPGIGLMFAGLGAVTVSMLITTGLLAGDDTLMQFIAFLLTTSVWAVLLWKPLQQFRLGKNKGSYSNIVGETATVNGSALTKEGGSVIWSGTIIQAKIADDSSIEQLPSGAKVIVTELRGATLIVTPKL